MSENNFYDWIERHGEKTAYVTEKNGAVTYGEFVRETDILRAKMKPRSLMLILCRNNGESLTAYIAALRNRTVPLLFNYESNEKLAEQIIYTYSPTYIFTARESSFNGYVETAFLGDYRLLSREKPVNTVVHDDLALLLTTSGSTGSPKLVRQSYMNIASNARAISQYLEIIDTDRPVTTLPMGYTYGLSIINSHLLMGASIALTDAALTQKQFWDFLKKSGVTTFGGVPYTYEMLKRLRFERMELPGLRYITQAGGRLQPELVSEFAKICCKKGIGFVVMYGQTEATARMSYLPADMVERKPASIGIAIPGGSFHLEDENGQIIIDSEASGELVYTGDNVTLGYAECLADLAKADENDGVLHTGDLAKRDADGYYYIVGRKSRFVKVYGNRVNLTDLEALLGAAGFDCVCAGKDNSLKIFTVLGDVSAIVEYMKAKTSLSRQGYSVIKIDEIPRNGSGKILYSELEKIGI